MDILKSLNMARRRVLISLWNPLVVIEFAHGAHIDAWMILFVVLSFWLLARLNYRHSNRALSITGSAVSLAGATLTKALPVLLAPLYLMR